jgi:putative ABC transport system permease protein
MSLWRQLKIGLRALTDRGAADRDADDEVRHYLAQSVAAHEARGLSPGEAHRAARLELGGVANVSEQIRGYGWENAVEQVVTDLRYALRTLAKHPSFTAVAVLSLGFGIGATTTVFSVIDALDLRGLPYRDASRLVWLAEVMPRDDSDCPPGDRCAFFTSPATATDWMDQSRSYEALAAVSHTGFAWQHGDAIERADANLASPGFFNLLGVRPLLGREFIPADTMADAEPALMVTYEFWQTGLGGDPSVVGSHLLSYYGSAPSPALRPITIIGVLPGNFAFGGAGPVWAPLSLHAAGSRTNRQASVIGRLKDGVTVAAADAELRVISARLAVAFPAIYGGWGASVRPLRDLIQFGTGGRGRFTLFAITALVLLIAVFNVAGLLLARGVAREPEFAMRSALGAGRVRVVRQLLVEGSCVGVAGGLAGLLLAVWGVRFVAQWFSVKNSGVTVGVDHRMLVFALAISFIVGIGAALAPALRAARADLGGSLRKRTWAAPSSGRVSNALIALQIALALVLLTAAGFLSADFLEVRYRDLGYDPTGVYSTSIRGTKEQWANPTTWKGVALATRSAVAAVPGLASAGIEYRSAINPQIVRASAPAASRPASRGPKLMAVDQGYITTWGIRLLLGRSFAATDRDGALPIAMVNKSAADILWHGKNPIGQQVFVGDSGSAGELLSVVGVVRDMERGDLIERHWPIVYRPIEQAKVYHSAATIAIRVPSGRPDLITAAQSAIRRTMGSMTSPFISAEAKLGNRFLTKRFNAIALNLFAGFGLLLAAMGIYGSVSYAVTQRNREIGIRMALGAERRNVLGLVARGGVLLAIGGATLGLVGALALTRVLRSFLAGTSGTNPWIFVGSALLMIIIALIATFLPARQATRVDPVIALRAE